MHADEFKQRLRQDLPGALAPEREPSPAALGDGAERGKQPPVDLLATSDAVVLPERLVDVALYVRDTLGYALLSNLTAVDYLADGLIEVVYHFVHLEGGPPLVVKTRVPRSTPIVPSLTPHWPGANLQEREAFDLYGVEFPGHPNLTRIYMWDEFEGFPMRKDFPKHGDKYIGDDDNE